MVLKVGINGFGRIGRVIFRTCLENTDLEVKAINDPAVDIEYISYLIKFDSTHGKLKWDVTFKDNEITINGNNIKVFREKNPSNIPWQSASIQYVVEASGIFTNYDKASGHLSSKCVKRVLVTAPSIDVPMLIIGVNEDRINKDQKVISCASSTLYCLAPIIKVLEDNYTVEEGFITSIHAMTPSLKPLDGLCLKGKHWRDHRSIHQNIIPAATGACKALGKIIPGVKDKLTGLAFRVPVVNVSVLDITIRLNKSTSIGHIVKIIEDQIRSPLKNIIKASSDEAVSSDFLGEEKSCILDVNSCLQLTPNFFKLICWYENEYSYACRVVDSIKFLEKNCQLELVPKNIFRRLSVTPRISKERPIPFYNRDLFCNTLIQNRSKFYMEHGFNERPPTPMGSRRHVDIHNSGSIQSIYEQKHNYSAQNRTSLFQSCAPFETPDKERKNYQKTQERLEEVKKEFSKMVDMTEKLLKKSKESNSHLEYSTPKEQYKEEKDIKNDLLRERVTPSGIKDMVIDNKDENLKDQDDAQVQGTKDDEFNDCSRLSDLGTSIDENDSSNDIRSVKNLNILSVNVEYIAKPNTKNERNDDTINDTFNYDKNYHRGTQNKTNLNESCTKEHSVNLATSVKNKTELEISESCSTSAEKQQNKIKNAIPNKTNAIEIKKKIIGEIIKKMSKDTAEETKDVSLIYKKSSITNAVGNKLNDIYDKLDSTSATDSENSFQIHERKSQIIELTDLTNSIEDLARLDKICRIIEISDELSDKLLSALDKKEPNYKRKKWSLKDLCETIKLDEFCNKVFGPQTGK
ncbi:uncharacterized protein LOC116771319 [Danaus plexippus]|uniref:uncharacterized protein LOC116771319 n=1 Tax=Danaus plexippus TaxID=13037 RepID=UPI002AB11D4A|nr:uncharacterized protein LOC116771319 [Danaus plexippus]